MLCSLGWEDQDTCKRVGQIPGGQSNQDQVGWGYVMGMKDRVSLPQFSLWRLLGLVTISRVCSHPTG